MKMIARVECDRVTIYKLKKGPRQMVSIASRLYRIDDRYMMKDINSDECLIAYDIDSTQPYMISPHPIDPDYTRALIDSAKMSGSKKSIWANLSGSKLMEYLTIFIVCGALLYGFLLQGGI